MRLLILGGRGMLAHKVVQVCRREYDCWTTIRGHDTRELEALGLPRERILQAVDATHADDLSRAFATVRPDVVINGIGLVKQLPAAADPVETIAINALLPHRLAALSAACGARLIHISTDCVYSGRRGGYTESDAADADDLYGRSKRLGEVVAPNAITIRTSFVGRQLYGSHGLVEWFLAQRRGATVRGFVRAFFSGLMTTALAEVIARIAVRHEDLMTGVHHVGADRISKYELLCLLAEAYGTQVTIEPDSSLEVDRSLDSTRFRASTGWTPDPWPTMISRMASESASYVSGRDA